MRPGTSNSTMKRLFFAALWSLGQIVLAVGVVFGVGLVTPDNRENWFATFLIAWFVSWVLSATFAGVVHDDPSFVSTLLTFNAIELVVGAAGIGILALSA